MKLPPIVQVAAAGKVAVLALLKVKLPELVVVIVLLKLKIVPVKLMPLAPFVFNSWKLDVPLPADCVIEEAVIPAAAVISVALTKVSAPILVPPPTAALKLIALDAPVIESASVPDVVSSIVLLNVIPPELVVTDPPDPTNVTALLNVTAPELEETVAAPKLMPAVPVIPIVPDPPALTRALLSICVIFAVVMTILPPVVEAPPPLPVISTP